jgi:hypothetical protein
VKFFDTACKVGALLRHHKAVYAAIPASCTGLSQNEGVEQNGCSAAVAPVGTPAAIAGARHPAILVYNSFSRMQDTGVPKGSRRCRFNDLALLRLSAVDARAAQGAIPGTKAPKRVSGHAPARGSRLSFGGSSAVSGGSASGGWVYPMTTAPSVSATDIGMPFAQGGRLVGMLTLIPTGMVVKSDAAAYNLHRALKYMHKMTGFHHVTLLRAKQRP